MTTHTSGAADLPESLLTIAREIEALKRECGMDPESPVAIQNGRYMAIAHKVRALAAGQAVAPATQERTTPTWLTDPTPTPDELEALARKHGATSYRNRTDTQHPAYGFNEDGLRSLLADALAKWGSPVVAGEPVAWYEYNADLDAWFLAYSHNPKAKTRPLVFGDTTPQPTQAQAGAVPLTQAKVVEAFCALPHQVQFITAFDQGVRFAERHHGIKEGGHHVVKVD